MKASNSSGVLPAGKVPMASSLARVSSLLMMRATSSDMRLTISRGVPAGASMPAQVLPVKPAKPCSMKVGTSGTAGRRLSPATPISRTLPALPWLMRPVGASKNSWICPPIRSVSAGTAPRYGMWIM
ncbi:hypothetical protein D3C87_568680 [compost metagenome]